MDMMWYRRRGLMVTPHIESVTGAIASFNSDYNKIPIKSLICDIEPIQEGEGDPSPENVRPISGRVGLSVARTGVNVWDEETELGGINSVDGAEYTSTNSIRAKNYIEVFPSTKYYFACSVNVTRCWYDEKYNYISTGYSGNVELTSPANAKYFRFSLPSSYGATYNHDISINYPATDTEYHAYKGSTYSVNWKSKAGTVYGGTLDVVSGKLTVDSGYIASYNGEALPSTWISDRDVYASGTTPTIGAHVVYELATPTEIQLTSQEVKAILGVNNIWCDSGNVSVNYWKWGK